MDNDLFDIFEEMENNPMAGMGLLDAKFDPLMPTPPFGFSIKKQGESYKFRTIRLSKLINKYRFKRAKLVLGVTGTCKFFAPKYDEDDDSDFACRCRRGKCRCYISEDFDSFAQLMKANNIDSSGKYDYNDIISILNLTLLYNRRKSLYYLQKFGASQIELCITLRLLAELMYLFLIINETPAEVPNDPVGAYCHFVGIKLGDKEHSLCMKIGCAHSDESKGLIGRTQTHFNSIMFPDVFPLFYIESLADTYIENVIKRFIKNHKSKQIYMLHGKDWIPDSSNRISRELVACSNTQYIIDMRDIAAQIAKDQDNKEERLKLKKQLEMKEEELDILKEEADVKDELIRIHEEKISSILIAIRNIRQSKGEDKGLAMEALFNLEKKITHEYG